MSNTELFTKAELEELAVIFGVSDADIFEAVQVYE
jgi:hypothetical protein